MAKENVSETYLNLDMLEWIYVFHNNFYKAAMARGATLKVQSSDFLSREHAGMLPPGATC